MTVVPVPDPSPNEFTVAGYNITSFFGFEPQLSKAALHIRDVMKYPDVVGMVEIASLEALQTLANRVNSDAGAANPGYAAYLIPFGDGSQHVGFLVKSSRVLVESVTQEQTNDTFIHPTGGLLETTHDRPPLVLTATIHPSRRQSRPCDRGGESSALAPQHRFSRRHRSVGPRQAHRAGGIDLAPVAGAAAEQHEGAGNLGGRLQRVRIQRRLHRSDVGDRRRADAGQSDRRCRQSGSGEPEFHQPDRHDVGRRALLVHPRRNAAGPRSRARELGRPGFVPALRDSAQQRRLPERQSRRAAAEPKHSRLAFRP